MCPLRRMVERLAPCPAPSYVQVPGGPSAAVMQQLEAEADAQWGVVGERANEPWPWGAMEANTRQVIIPETRLMACTGRISGLALKIPTTESLSSASLPGRARTSSHRIGPGMLPLINTSSRPYTATVATCLRY